MTVSTNVLIREMDAEECRDRFAELQIKYDSNPDEDFYDAVIRFRIYKEMELISKQYQQLTGENIVK